MGQYPHCGFQLHLSYGKMTPSIFFLPLFTICISHFHQFLFILLAYFLAELLVTEFLEVCMSIFHDTQFANTSSHSSSCLFTQLTASSIVQKPASFTYPICLVSPVLLPKNSSPIEMPWFPLRFPPTVFFFFLV